MPQPNVQDVHVSSALTNISVAYLQDNDHYIADKVFPIVPVQHQTDQYYVWSKDDFFRDEAQARADATESTGTGFNLGTKSYAARVYALHKDIGTQIRANADPAVDLDAATTRILMQKLLIKRDRLFVQKYMTTGIWGTDRIGTVGGQPGTATPSLWSDDANGDPFTDLANAQTLMLQTTGYEPNKLTLAFPVYQALKRHPLVIDRIKYTSQPNAKSITPQLLAAIFDVDTVVVAKAVYNSAAEGLAGVYNFIMPNSALFSYAPSAPGLMEPSAGYLFGWSGFTGLNNLGVRSNQIPMDWLGVGTIRDECEMAFDMQQVSGDLGVYFSNIA